MYICIHIDTCYIHFEVLKSKDGDGEETSKSQNISLHSNVG